MTSKATDQSIISISALLLVSALFPLQLLASDVLVQVKDGRDVSGQGSLQKRGNECLVITPKHVVKDAFSPIVVTFPDRQIIEASVLQEYAEDIALLRLVTQPVRGCSEQAFMGEGLPGLLESLTEGVLKRRQQDGSAALTQVDVVGYDEHRSIRVEPRSAGKSIKQGYSGSVLYLDNKAVGMLINIEGAGVVLRAELINATVGPFFSAASGDYSLALSLDTTSMFLKTAIEQQARQHQFALQDETADASFRMQVTTLEDLLETETDKIVRYKTNIRILDQLDRVVLDQTIDALGNSFVNLDAALNNVRGDLLKRLQDADPLNKLP